MPRFYIQAFDIGGLRVEGEEYAEAEIHSRAPTSSNAWNHLHSTKRAAYPKVALWLLVDEQDRPIRHQVNWRNGYPTSPHGLHTLAGKIKAWKTQRRFQ